MEIRESYNPEGKRNWRGRLCWIDGKDVDDKPKFQWIDFFTSDEKVAKILIENRSLLFKIEGWLKIKRTKEEDKHWKVLPYLRIVRAQIYVKPIPVVEKYSS